MPNDTQQFEAMSRLEESILKARGLAALMSRIIKIGDQLDPFCDLDADGIQALSDSVSHETGIRFAEAFHNARKPAAVQSPVTTKTAA